MPRFNVQHPVTKEWRCFSTIVDDYVTDWMDEERYQEWRLFQCGQNAGEYFYNETFMPCMGKECACFKENSVDAYCDRNGAFMTMTKEVTE